jgi:hypothetical protein
VFTPVKLQGGGEPETERIGRMCPLIRCRGCEDLGVDQAALHRGLLLEPAQFGDHAAQLVQAA